MRGLHTWMVCCFRGLAEIKMASIIKRRDLALLKITHKALYDDVWPVYLRLKFHTVSAYNLRSLEAPKLAIPTESGTFQDSAARLLIRYLTDYNKFVRLSEEAHVLRRRKRMTDFFIFIIIFNHAAF